MLYDKISGKRPAGKHKSRWIEAVDEDARKILSIRNWKR
jgi:hypothetical protein